jgi:hypothetical protein
MSIVSSFGYSSAVPCPRRPQLGQHKRTCHQNLSQTFGFWWMNGFAYLFIATTTE